MSSTGHRNSLQPDGEDHITFAVREAVRQAIEDHARTGDPIVIWRDGKVVHVPPEEIPALLASYAEPDDQPAPSENGVPSRTTNR